MITNVGKGKNSIKRKRTDGMRSEEEREGERKKESREEFVVVGEEQLLAGGQTRVAERRRGEWRREVEEVL